MKNLTALNELLEDIESEKIKLKERIEELEEEKSLENLRWQKTICFNENDFRNMLPIPRLEMRVKQMNHRGVEWHYGIVKKHYGESGENLDFIPLGHTTGSGYSIEEIENDLPLPFRDGVHIQADSFILDLPAYVVCESAKKWKQVTANESIISTCKDKKLKTY